MNNRLYVLFLLLPFSGAFAADGTVVGLKDFSSVTPADSAETRSKDPASAALLRAFAADLEKGEAFEANLPLTDFPTWGKTVEGASGVVRYHARFSGGFVGHVTLQGLIPNHVYILTLNGNPERAGNNNLVSHVPGNEKEKYYDFQIVMTNAAGSFTATYAIALPKGDYDLRFYVKDTSDYKIVLYHDFFPFKVE